MELTEYLEKKLVHSFHTSERRAARSCPRRHRWVYKDMYYPTVTPPPLEFGVAFHKAMETFYQPLMWGRDFETQRIVAQAEFADTCHKQLNNYRRLNGEPEVEVITEYRERLALGLNMIRYYCEKISPIYDRGFVPIEVEVPFEVLVLSPQGEPIWCKCEQCFKKWTASEAGKTDVQKCKTECCKTREYDEYDYKDCHWRGLPVTYGGRLDMLARDDLGRYWIFDWKTTSRMLNEGKEESFLELDDQVASYCWALSTMGIPVAGFVYVEIKKDYPRPPEKLSRPYRNKLFSVNRQNMTTYDLYMNTILSEDYGAYDAGHYDDFLEWLKNDGPKFHQRHQIHKNDHEISEIGNNIYLEALDIVNNPRDYPTPGRFSCPTCLYRQPCLEKNQGGDYEYLLQTLFEKRTRHYYEDEQPSTE